MKRYLTYIFIGIGILILIVGLRMEARWSGMVTWGLATICFIFSALFTKFIPND